MLLYNRDEHEVKVIGVEVVPLRYNIVRKIAI